MQRLPALSLLLVMLFVANAVAQEPRLARPQLAQPQFVTTSQVVPASQQAIPEVVPAEPLEMVAPPPPAEEKDLDMNDEWCDCEYCTGGAWDGGWLGRFMDVLRANMDGSPELFHERPHGSLVIANMETQVYNGMVDRMVLYHYDFVDDTLRPDGTQLNLRGQEQLRKIVQLAQVTGEQIVIQGLPGNERVDQARRRDVIRHLEKMQAPISPDAVAVAHVPILGLGAAGERKMPGSIRWNITYDGRLRQTAERGSRRLLQTIGVLNQGAQ